MIVKKFLSFFLCIVLCLVCSACGDYSENQSNISSSDTNSTIELINQENVKISFSGTSKDIGIGEGIYLLVENSRSESIIVNIIEVSLNDIMQSVIQPQMPLHLTSPGKKSTQPYVFTNIKDLNGKAQFKIKVMNENFEELFVSDFVEVSF